MQSLLTRAVCAASLAGWLACTVWSAELGLDPPSNHWVYQLPHEQQTQLVSITVAAFDEQDQPVGNADLMAYCEPWDYVIRDRIGDTGEIRLRGPVGDWTFFIGADRGPGRAVLIGRGPVKVREDCAVDVGTQQVVELSYAEVVDRRGRGRRARAQTEELVDAVVHFMPACRPAPLSLLYLCHLSDGPLRLSVTPGIDGYLILTRPPEEGRLGYALFDRYATGASTRAQIADADVGHLMLEFAGYPEHRVAVDITLQPVHPDFCEGSAAQMRMSVTPEGVRRELQVSPGDYHLWLALVVDDQYVATYTPFRVQVAPGQAQTVRLGGRFGASPFVREWTDRKLGVWFDVYDELGNCLEGRGGDTFLVLTQGGNRVFEGAGRSGLERYFEVERNWGPAPNRQPVSFEFHTRTPLWGDLASMGELPTQPWSPADLPSTYETEHLRVIYREKGSELAARNVATFIESAMTWLGENLAGPVHHPNGAQWRIEDVSPAGWACASDDGVCLSVYAPYHSYETIAGGAGMLTHEFGHIYENSPPHHPVSLLDKSPGGTFNNGRCSIENESMASTISSFCMRLRFGEKAWHLAGRTYNGYFFDLLTGRRRDLDDHDRYFFLLHYLNECFGQAINCDFVRAMHGSEGNIEQVVASDKSLQTFHEMMAAIYSYLAGENLAWLWRWAGYPVADEKIEQAMAYFDEHEAFLPEKQ